MTLLWPSTDGLNSWLRARLTDATDTEGLRLSGTERIRIDSTVDANDIASLTIDASRVALEVEKPSPGGATGAARARDTRSASASTPAAVSSTPGVLRTARLVAAPVNVDSIPVHLDVNVEDLPFDWAPYAQEQTPGDPTSRFTLTPHDDAEGAHGTFTVRMRADDIPALLHALLRPALDAGGARLRDLRIDLTETAEGVNATVSVHARWKLLAVRVRADLTVVVDPDGIVTLTAARLSSRNPIVNLFLRAVAEGEVDPLVGVPHDLNDGPTGSLRIRDLRLRAGHDVILSGRLNGRLSGA